MSPPEFFVDRSLGKTTAAKLAQLGWTVHLVTDAFPNDAQNTPDEEWIAYGLGHGWAMLSKDQRIRYATSRSHPISSAPDLRSLRRRTPLEIREAQKLAWDNKIAKGFNTVDVPLEFGLLTAEVGETFAAGPPSSD